MILTEASYRRLRFAGHPARPPNPRRARSAATRPTAAEAPSLAPDEQQLAELILTGAGLHWRQYQPAPLRRRLAAVLRAIRAADLLSAANLVSRDSRCRDRALNALLIGYTAPFRDPDIFRALRDQILPKLAKRGTGPLRVWSMGCSTGEELLSVAWLLAQLGLHHGARLRGSDCRPAAIATARHRTEEFLSMSMPAFASDRSLVDQHRFRQIAAHIEWCVDDVLTCSTEGPWDLVLCRNLTIYLAAPHADELWSRIASCLSPGGIFIAGKAERARNCPLRRIDRCIYQAEEG